MYAVLVLVDGVRTEISRQASKVDADRDARDLVKKGLRPWIERVPDEPEAA